MKKMTDKNYVLYYLDKKILLSPESVYRIGRAGGNEILLDEATVSRSHARIFFKADKWFIEDLQSSNGTLINYKKVTIAELRDCDRIMIGPFHCVFRVFYHNEIPEYNALVSDTLILEKKIQDIFYLLPNAESRKKIYDLKHFINGVRRKMDAMANIDRLTRVHNRAFFDDRLAMEMERAKRYDQDLCLIMFDIDRFKKCNDIHGHQKGDEVLAVVARIIKENTRTNDIVARYGGEEFVVILPQSTLAHTKTAAEKIRRMVESLSQERTGLRITMSGGIASGKSAGYDITEIIRQADQAMYNAKKQGRNRICEYVS